MSSIVVLGVVIVVVLVNSEVSSEDILGLVETFVVSLDISSDSVISSDPLSL